MSHIHGCHVLFSTSCFCLFPTIFQCTPVIGLFTSFCVAHFLTSHSLLGLFLSFSVDLLVPPHCQLFHLLAFWIFLTSALFFENLPFVFQPACLYCSHMGFPLRSYIGAIQKPPSRSVILSSYTTVTSIEINNEHTDASVIIIIICSYNILYSDTCNSV